METLGPEMSVGGPRMTVAALLLPSRGQRGCGPWLAEVLHASGSEVESCLSPLQPWAEEEMTHFEIDRAVFKGPSRHLSSAGHCPPAAGCQACNG